MLHIRGEAKRSMKSDRQQAVVQQFNRDAGAYLTKQVRPETLREQKRLFGLANTGRRYRRALDLGCGPGTMTADMLRISDEVWGVDSSERMIEIATGAITDETLHNKLHFEVGSAEKLRFPDESFDLVFCVGVLRYLTSWENGLKEIYRVLKPNGVLVATFYYRFSMQWFYMSSLGRPLSLLRSLSRRLPLKEAVQRLKAEPLPFSYSQCRNVLAAIGFAGIRCQHSGFEVYPLRRLLPDISRSIYLALEDRCHDSDTLGWLGSICIVKAVKQASPAASR